MKLRPASMAAMTAALLAAAPAVAQSKAIGRFNDWDAQHMGVRKPLMTTAQ